MADQQHRAGSHSGLAATARWATTIHCLALLAQIVTVIVLVAGRSEALRLHAINAWIVTGIGVVQAIALLSCGRDRLGQLLTFFALALPFFEFAQIQLGRSGNLSAHASLGLAIWAMGLALLIKVLRSDWLEPR